MLSNDPQRHLQLKEKIKILGNSPSGKLLRALVTDIEEASLRTNRPVKISRRDLGLPELITNTTSSTYHLQKEMAQRPEWRFVLEDPKKVIESLFLQKKWIILRQLIYAQLTSPEVKESLATHLLQRPAEGAIAELQLFFLRNNIHTKQTSDYIGKVLSLPTQEAQKHAALLLMYFQNREWPKALNIINLLVLPSSEKIADLIRIWIESMSQTELTILRSSSLWQKHQRFPAFKILDEATQIVDENKRRDFLNENYVNQDYLKGLDVSPLKAYSSNRRLCRSLFQVVRK